MSHFGSQRRDHAGDNDVLHGASSSSLGRKLYLHRALYQRTEGALRNRVCEAIPYYEQADFLQDTSTTIKLSHSAVKLRLTIMQTIIAPAFLLRLSRLSMRCYN